MSKAILIFVCLFYFLETSAQKTPVKIVTTDIDNFWKAYDKMITTTDTLVQLQYLNDIYYKKGTQGLKDIMEARNYTLAEYVQAINKYPRFWNSIRKNTYKSKRLLKEISNDISSLKTIYKSLKSAPIYFTIGAFRTNGTVLNNHVLIGSEMAMADKNVDITELPESLHYFYTTFNPLRDISLLCTHEYVHTQQKPFVENLLSISIYEGVAEFVSTLATNKPSYTPAVGFGEQHSVAVKAKFEQDLFIPDRLYNWVWGNNRNELKERDLGYYIGYSICKRYYEMATDKKKAISEMIEMDYTDESMVERFVDTTQFLSAPLSVLYSRYELSRPYVTSIEPIINGSQDVVPGTQQITLHFSTALNKINSGFDYGPLGESVALRVKKVIGFSADGKSFTFEVEMKAGQHYQTLVTNSFRTVEGIRLKPFLIDVKTRE